MWLFEKNTHHITSVITLLIFVFPLLKQTKKKLGGLTREHEALFNFVENNKQICTEKEKQKAKVLFTSNTCSVWKCCQRLIRFFCCCLLQMLNRLTKSTELQTRVDEEYFKINMEGHQMRLKLENTLKNCFQVRRKILHNSSSS